MKHTFILTLLIGIIITGCAFDGLDDFSDGNDGTTIYSDIKVNVLE